LTRQKKQLINQNDISRNEGIKSSKGFQMNDPGMHLINNDLIFHILILSDFSYIFKLNNYFFLIKK
jgi:hypothetical protein